MLNQTIQPNRVRSIKQEKFKLITKKKKKKLTDRGERASLLGSLGLILARIKMAKAFLFISIIYKIKYKI